MPNRLVRAVDQYTFLLSTGRLWFRYAKHQSACVSARTRFEVQWTIFMKASVCSPCEVRFGGAIPRYSLKGVTLCVNGSLASGGCRRRGNLFRIYWSALESRSAQSISCFGVREEAGTPREHGSVDDLGCCSHCKWTKMVPSFVALASSKLRVHMENLQ